MTEEKDPIVTARKFQAELVKNDTCPRCLGELDTGWECTDCGFDALTLLLPEQERK